VGSPEKNSSEVISAKIVTSSSWSATGNGKMGSTAVRSATCTRAKVPPVCTPISR